MSQSTNPNTNNKNRGKYTDSRALPILNKKRWDFEENPNPKNERKKGSPEKSRRDTKVAEIEDSVVYKNLWRQGQKKKAII